MKNYDSIISDNYEKVYDHFKEQDQLRNTSFGFFTTITLGVFGFIAAGEYTVEARLAFILLFIIGILFSVLACRYKYYGNIHSVTMKVLRYLSAGEENCTRKNIDGVVEKSVKAFSMNLYSADLIIYLCLVLVNLFNLYNSMIGVRWYIILIASSVYFISALLEYFLLVVRKSRLTKAGNLSFIDVFYNN